MNIIESAMQMVDACNTHGVTARLLGGIAVAIQCAPVQNPGRSYRDIDVYVPAKSQQPLTKVMHTLGYQAADEFNLLNGDTRLLFHHSQAGYQVDVFVGSFQMCHRIPIRTSTHAYTIPLAELLLTKLQIFELNPKDAHDGCALLSNAHIGTASQHAGERAVIANLCSRDWGLWRTFTMNLERCISYTIDHCPEQTAAVSAEVQALRHVIDDAPKSMAFKLRATIGDAMPWYELPEEVDR
jgi:hypothetical protein